MKWGVYSIRYQIWPYGVTIYNSINLSHLTITESLCTYNHVMADMLPTALRSTLVIGWDIPVKLWPALPTGIVGLDFKASRIVAISGSALPLQCTMVILNNKGYPIYHPRITQYSHERVNTRLNKFQFTEENSQVYVGMLVHGLGSLNVQCCL